MNELLFCLENVKKSYDKGCIDALDEISLDIARGSFISVVGPSGSGKSTLLHMLSGLDVPDSGIIKFEGHQPTPGDQWRRIRAERIGLVFQAFHLLPTLTALENIEVPMFGVVASATDRKGKALKLISKVGLSNRRNHYPNELSGGERQRVAIARAMSNSPDILLADEPTGNLDSRTSADIIDILIDFHKTDGSTLVIVTHDEKIAGSAEIIIRMLDGKIDQKKV